MNQADTTQITRRQDFWLWRLLATGLAFSLFGAGSIILHFLVFPAQRLAGGDAQTRQRRARWVVHHTFRLFTRFMIGTGVLTMQLQNIQKLGRPGQMIIANHPSLLDVVFLISLIPNANCIVKRGLYQNIFTCGPIRACGYIPNDASAEMLDKAAQVLRQGETLIIFPEGTRTPLNEAPRFHRGACAIALRGASHVTPVVIHMQPRSLAKGMPWYHIPHRRMHYRIEAGEDISPLEWEKKYPLPIAGRKMNEYLHNYFDTTLQLNRKIQNFSPPSHNKTKH
ncbi:acyltransferase [Cephaloticoccus primus]|uniref:Acyltransferase n=1 Tax=Cephaloticoccus primus TaxID=1548207 RepID=A0A139SQI9_9BACT|nr:acyltransferase [Cephaloticoccus primus]